MELCDGGAVTDIFSVSQDPLTEEQISTIMKETLRVFVIWASCCFDPENIVKKKKGIAVFTW